MRPRVSRIGAPLSSIGQLAVVLGDQHGVVGETHDGAEAEHLARRVLHRLPRRLVDDAEYRVQRVAQRLGAPAGEGLRDRVQQRDPPLRVGHHDRVPDAGEGGAKTLALGVQHVGRPLAGGLVARDQRDDHRDQDQTQRETNHGAGERGAGVGARVRLPPGEQRALELLHAVDLVADQIHQALPLPLEQVLPGERERPARVGLGPEAVEPLPQHREPLGHELLEPEHVRGLRRIVHGERPEPREVARDSRRRLLVGLEIDPLAGQEIAALTGLGVLEGGDDLLELALHLVGVRHPLHADRDLADVVQREDRVGQERDDQQGHRDGLAARQAPGHAGHPAFGVSGRPRGRAPPRPGTA